MPETTSSIRFSSLPGGILILATLLGMLFLSNCSHTSSHKHSFSPKMSAHLPILYADAATSSETSVEAELEDDTQPADATEDDPFEDDPFEDDPFEDDPFEDDPFEDDPFEDNGSDSAMMAEVADPIEGWNRLIFQFNDKLYTWVFIPVADGYRFVMPSTLRLGLRNFFNNLAGPLRFVNCILQGKGEAADAELVRFVMNSTIGGLGFGNPAKKYPRLNPNKEDLGQTFGRWGIGQGFYIVWPVIGPSTVRDSFGKAGDFFLTPTTYVEPFDARVAIVAVDYLNEFSYYTKDYESLKNAALDPYEAFRNFYIQFRKTQVSK